MKEKTLDGMEGEFVPYELVVKIKELGFSSNNLNFYSGCFAYYGDETSNLKGKLIPNNIMRKHFRFNYSEFIMAPLWQQAFDWFREKYNFDSYVRKTTYRQWKLQIKYILQNDSEEEWENYKYYQDYKDTQKEAREACLEKLIEIVESRRK